MSNEELLQVAKIGRLVGLKGELKLHIQCDFPEQFHPGAAFLSEKNLKLTIEKYNSAKNTVIFEGYNSREKAAELVNKSLLTSKQDSFINCDLKEGEFFWFDMIGAQVREGDKILGSVEEIERIAINDYLLVKTSIDLVEQKLPKNFYIPYIERYIDRFDNEEKIVYTKDAYGLLENS
ncbi:MAG: ribosome maturation factor RimM [Sulfurospirillaceae bacterium]|nr:ribosome maturation factor RimM [Sulfurospirillaceae bacterium]